MNNDSVLQAILLLCSFFNKNESKYVKPLTPTEYSRLAEWLYQNRYTPADFISREEELLTEWYDPKERITKARLTELLQRAASMGFALEKWGQQQVWVLSRASQEYPKVLKETLGNTRSPLLYGIGEKSLLNTNGIGFVGSRDTDSDDETFTQSLAQQAVEQGFTVVSGGARGVDQTSMIAALDAGGSAIGILADSLLKAATKSQYRKALQEGRLLLISPYYPEAAFSKGYAMGRNKYIYALSKGVVVAKSDVKGGTWSGANENIKKQWVPLWVRDIENTGNQKLIELGGQPISGDKVDFTVLQSSFSFERIVTNRENVSSPPVGDENSQNETGDFFVCYESASIEENTNEIESRPKSPEMDHESDQATDKTQGQENERGFIEHEPVQGITETALQGSLGAFLDLFCMQLQQQKGSTFVPKALAETFPELSEAIIKQWLKTLEEKGLVKREGKKLAYTLVKWR